MNKIVQIIYTIFIKILSIIFNNLKQEKIIIFESNPSYTDNTRAVFDEMIRQHLNQDYRMFWLVREEDGDFSFLKSIKNVGLIKSTKKNYLMQMWYTCIKAYYFSKATAIISCNVFQPKFTKKNQYYIHLNHGASNKNSKEYYKMPMYYSETVSMSEYFAPYLADELSCSLTKVITLGYPRNDILFNPDPNINMEKLFPNKEFKKVIYWLPTFRQHIFGIDSHSDISMPIMYNVEIAKRINEVAKQCDCLIVVKPHPVQDIRKLIQVDLSNIIFINNPFFEEHSIDSYEFLSATDALISDYSSVYYDYLICDKPIGLCFDDFDEYKKRIGFIIDPAFVYSGGELIYTSSDMCEFIRSVANNVDRKQTERRMIKSKIYSNADNNATIRVTNHIINNLKKQKADKMLQSSNRTKNAIYNIVFQGVYSLFSIILSLANRYIFLKVLDATYLGVSGLFSNITLVFSLVELGMGNALNQLFFKPLAEKDYKHLSQVTHTTKTLLNIVGFVIILLTLLFTPFLQFFVNDINAIPNMRLIFFLYGMSSSITYFLSYYRGIINANQQAYKLVKIDSTWKIITLVLQSLVLIITRNFIIYLTLQIILSVCLNFIVRWYVKKEIPYIDYKCKEYISKTEQINLKKNIAGLSLYKFASIITNGTDNFLISKFLDLTVVGLASNYYMIQQSVLGIVESIFSPLLASIGNLCVSESNEKKYLFFNRLSFAAFWIYGFCSISAFILADDFISMLFGHEYCIPNIAVFFMMLDLFCVGLFRTATLYRTAEGLFWVGKFRPLFQALVNLIVSLLLLKVTHKLWAIYAGTVASRILITVWYEPYIVLKNVFNIRCREYFNRLLYYIIAYSIAIGITSYIDAMLPLEGMVKLLCLSIICIIMINLIFGIAFIKTEEFKFWESFVKDFWFKNLKKGK